MKVTFRKAPAPYNYVEMVFTIEAGQRPLFDTFSIEEGHNTARLEYIEQDTTPATIEDARQIKTIIDYYEREPCPISIEPVPLEEIKKELLFILINRTTARAIFDSNKEVFLVYPDGTEAVAVSVEEINKHRGTFAVEREEAQK